MNKMIPALLLVFIIGIPATIFALPAESYQGRTAVNYSPLYHLKYHELENFLQDSYGGSVIISSLSSWPDYILPSPEVVLKRSFKSLVLFRWIKDNKIAMVTCHLNVLYINSYFRDENYNLIHTHSCTGDDHRLPLNALKPLTDYTKVKTSLYN